MYCGCTEPWQGSCNAPLQQCPVRRLEVISEAVGAGEDVLRYLQSNCGIVLYSCGCLEQTQGVFWGVQKSPASWGASSACPDLWACGRSHVRSLGQRDVVRWPAALHGHCLCS